MKNGNLVELKKNLPSLEITIRNLANENVNAGI